jgi:hypothetical protein
MREIETDLALTAICGADVLVRLLFARVGVGGPQPKAAGPVQIRRVILGMNG